ncbi:MAG: hypothetical protein AAFZ04_15445 [Pseudomonadota bacterium]
MNELPQTTEVLTAFGALLAGVAAFWGACTAQRGLSTWKKQVRSGQDQKLAMDIYSKFRQRKTIYHYIRSLNSDRPVISISVYDEAIRQAWIDNDRIEVKMLYWQALKDTEREQQLSFDEAKLRWGVDYLQMSQSIRDLEYELICALDDVRAIQSVHFDGSTDTEGQIQEITTQHRDKANRKDTYDSCFRVIEKSLKDKIVLT